MTTAQHTTQHYIGDLVAVIRHVLEAMERHAKDDRLARITGATATIDNATTVLRRQLAGLEFHAQSIGGTGVTGAVKEAVTSVTGFLTGLYGTLRSETASRMLRDHYTSLSFVLICTEMLHATSLAIGDARTADLTRQHVRELPPVIKSISSLVPYAVVADVAADHVPIANPDAAEICVRTHSAAWHDASAPREA